jgi:hypothetical protein
VDYGIVSNNPPNGTFPAPPGSGTSGSFNASAFPLIQDTLTFKLTGISGVSQSQYGQSVEEQAEGLGLDLDAWTKLALCRMPATAEDVAKIAAYIGLEDRVVAECVVVVLVLVAGQDAVDARPDHLQEGVLGQVGVTGVIQGLGKGPGQADALVKLADGEQSGVAGELARRRLDDEWRAEEVEDLGPGGGYTHQRSP